MAAPLDRTLPLYRDDPVISRLTDDEVSAFAGLLARLAASYARRLEAEGVSAEDVPARIAADANAPPGADIRTARLAGAGRGAHRRENY
jgi:hypothetical protein